MKSGIKVSVTSQFDSQRSGTEQYIYQYSVRIENQSEQVVQLLRRYWLIEDGRGNKQEIEGEGVVGEQPVIAPGEHFDYDSFAVLTTPSATMSGHYLMRPTNGRSFQAPVAEFLLAKPDALH